MLIKLSQAPALVEKVTGERPHVLTIHRWARKGVRGVRLRSAFAGGIRRTSAEWLDEFFAELNRQDERRNGGSLAEAEKALEKAGI